MTEVSWYGFVRTYVASSAHSVVHNSAGHDIARTMWPRMLKLSVYITYGIRKKPIYFQGQISRSLCLYKEFWHLDHCGQDIARIMQSTLFKLSMFTSYGKRKKPIYFQSQRSNFKFTWHLQRIMALGSLLVGYTKKYAVSILKLSMYTSYES